MNAFNFGYYSAAFLFVIIGILIISPLVFIPIFILGKTIRIFTNILRFFGLFKENQNENKFSNHDNYANEFGVGKIVDLGEHVGVLTKISKKRIAEDYIRNKKASNKDFSEHHKEKSYNEKMSETMDQEAQAKGWY